MPVARWFDKDKYDGSSPFGGVPVRNIDEEEWEAFPKHVQDSADALPYFRKTNPNPTPRKGTDEQKET